MQIFTRLMLVFALCFAQAQSLAMASCIDGGSSAETEAATTVPPDLPPCHTMATSSELPLTASEASDDCCADNCPCPALAALPHLEFNTLQHGSRAVYLSAVIASPNSFEQALLRPPTL